jgi:hypothetical protein
MPSLILEARRVHTKRPGRHDVGEGHYFEDLEQLDNH